MMELKETEWHVRLYRWCNDVLDRFSATVHVGDSNYITERGTDLCSYLRTIGSGIVVAALSCAWVTLIGYMIVSLFSLLGLGGTSLLAVITGLIMCTFLFVMWLGAFGIPEGINLAKKAFSKKLDDPNSFVSILVERYESHKDKYCNTIRFDGTSKNEQNN